VDESLDESALLGQWRNELNDLTVALTEHHSREPPEDGDSRQQLHFPLTDLAIQRGEKLLTVPHSIQAKVSRLAFSTHVSTIARIAGG
jgi:hypothetical protein